MSPAEAKKRLRAALAHAAGDDERPEDLAVAAIAAGVADGAHGMADVLAARAEGLAPFSDACRSFLAARRRAREGRAMTPAEAKKRLAAAAEAGRRRREQDAGEAEDRGLDRLSLPELLRFRDLLAKAGRGRDLSRLTPDQRRLVELLSAKTRAKAGAEREAVNAGLRAVNARVPWPPPPCDLCDDGSGRPRDYTPAQRERINQLLDGIDRWPRGASSATDCPGKWELSDLLGDAPVGTI